MASRGDYPHEVLTTPDEWRTFLVGYGRLYVDSLSTFSVRTLDEQQRRTAWFGREPAGEQAVSAAAERLGAALPPSLHAFLLVSDGWTGVGGWLDEVCGLADLKWFRDDESGMDLIELFSEEDEEDEIAADFVQLFTRSLLVAWGEDFWLLDPEDVGPDGEWTAAVYQPKYGELETHRGFSALMANSRRFMEKRLPRTGNDDR